ncbi:MAG TPA: alanine racemase [Candidatus Absconditabacterales bacterium]|nr:alanine racemase [Candidatus Absconditabacterales bacterium]HNG97184.1 alanine racemase [Candidatus Absconditabacterales bacterium]
MDFYHTIKHFFNKKSSYQSLNTITIKRQAIEHNFKVFQHHKPDYIIIPVVKSNGYGHGIKQIATILQLIPLCYMIAVDSYPEYQIINTYTNKKILMLGETRGENYRLFDYKRTHLAVRTLETIKILGLLSTHQEISIHIFVNTGMNREGVQIEHLHTLLDCIKSYPNVKVTGYMSHLACADDPGNKLNQIQVNRFYEGLQIVRNAGYEPLYIHLEASAGMINNTDTVGECTAGRLGLGLYGYDPMYLGSQSSFSPLGSMLQPAMDVYSTITAIQIIDTGGTVGYGSTWTAEHKSLIATFPFGYKEGLDRQLSSIGWEAGIGSKLYPLVGRISMNYSTLYGGEPGGGNGLAIGNQVHIISSDLNQSNTMYHYFYVGGKIVYEMIHRDPMIKRVII